VAVPVRDEGDVLVGVLGASVHLDQLSARLENEMAVGERWTVRFRRSPVAD
jgi:DNA-binding IclR family transcriptional regulator